MPGLLRAALEAHSWDDVNHRLNESFYFYLFVDPEALQIAFGSAPSEWYDRYPRHVLSRAIFEAVSRPGLFLDHDAVHRFSAWVQSQPHPAARDVLGVQQAGMAALLAAGRYHDAAVAADRAVEIVRTASDQGGFPDILPTVMLRCGTAKLLVGCVDEALTLFSEALRWARVRGEHPWARYARDHIALARALMERYKQAAEILDANAADDVVEPGTLRYHYRLAGVMARALVAMGTVPPDGRTNAVAHAHQLEDLGDWWWVPVHLRANSALVAGTQREMMHEIRERLSVEGHRANPSTTAGAALRADLATLGQSVGDLTTADRVLSSPHLTDSWPFITIARARQHWLAGRTGSALGLLQEGRRHNTDAISDTFPTAAVLHAQVELDHTGFVSDHVLHTAVAAIGTSGATVGLTQASDVLRSMLRPHLAVPIDAIPIRFAARERIRLTHRERDILAALEHDISLPELARRLHLSTNTIKTHVRNLYRKLGAHNRDDAIRLGKNTI